MSRITGTIEILAPPQRVYDFCTDCRNLELVFPKDVRVEVVRRPEAPLEEGDEIALRFHHGGLAYPWDSVITCCDPCRVFEDVQVRGPMKRWVSRHTFEATPRGTRVTHVIDYELHFGILGRVCALIGADPLLRRFFRHAHRAIKDVVERQHREGTATNE